MNSSSPFPHILRKSERINFTGYDLQRPSNHHLTKHPIILDPSKLTKIIDHEFIEICKEKRYYFEIMTFFSGYKVKEVPFESSQSKKKKKLVLGNGGSIATIDSLVKSISSKNFQK